MAKHEEKDSTLSKRKALLLSTGWGRCCCAVLDGRFSLSALPAAFVVHRRLNLVELQPAHCSRHRAKVERLGALRPAYVCRHRFAAFSVTEGSLSFRELGQLGRAGEGLSDGIDETPPPLKDIGSSSALGKRSRRLHMAWAFFQRSFRLFRRALPRESGSVAFVRPWWLLDSRIASFVSRQQNYEGFFLKEGDYFPQFSLISSHSETWIRRFGRWYMYRAAVV